MGQDRSLRHAVVVLVVLVTAVSAPVPAAMAAEKTTVTTGSGADETTVATDESFSGFTLGAAIVAVFLVGTYRYLRA